MSVSAAVIEAVKRRVSPARKQAQDCAYNLRLARNRLSELEEQVGKARGLVERCEEIVDDAQAELNNLCEFLDANGAEIPERTED